MRQREAAERRREPPTLPRDSPTLRRALVLRAAPVTMPDPRATSSLEQLVAEIAESLGDDVSTSPGGAGRTWSRGETAFAIAGPLGVEIFLDRQVAAAAARTPDTAPSPRGPDWIRFNPRELDPHALDRVRAWLELGYRRAGE